MNIDILGTVFDSTADTVAATANVSLSAFALCSATALALGFIIGVSYRYKNKTSEGFTVAMALLPVVVQMVIMLVSGNLGAAVAVMGVFSLV
ncbi:MAG: hypothetical protein BZ138_06285, partial [Methanosphaera sp. rholeuAM270]